MPQPRRYLSLRIPADDFAQIDQLAAEHGLNRTDYIVRVATGKLQDPIKLDERFNELEQRLERVEHACFG